MPVRKPSKVLSILLFSALACALLLALAGCGAKEPAFDLALGAETDQAVYMTNATGQTIIGVAVAEEGSDFGDSLMPDDAALADGQVAKVFLGTPAAEEEAAEAEENGEAAETAEDAGETAADAADAADAAEEGSGEEAAPETAEETPQPSYNIQVTFDDGTTATLYNFDASLAQEFSLCFEDEVAFITYTDGEGNEVSTKDDALAYKEEMERKAAEEAAAAQQQQYYYYNSYGADTSAGQGKTGCLF